MDNTKIRTRFAPSPTGYMHIGNLRTALFTYLIAKKNNGTFVLRIEDTDQERFVEGAVDLIYRTLKKTGIIWDEGPDIGGNYGPYVQSERMGMFREYAQKLIDNGSAYYCFCHKERLEELRKVQEASHISPRYDRHCCRLSQEEIDQKLRDGEPYVIRQKVPEVGTTTFHDEIYGDITVENSSLDDQILIKTDGMPTYNFANVVDDHTMEITHVVRGNEYLSSTPKYNLLYEAFGWVPPLYIHVEHIMKNATEKLSKRNGDASFEDLLAKGYLTEAIINYIALLGWAPKGEEEIFTMDQLIQEFDISGLSKAPAIFDPLKLKAINGIYIRKLSLEEFTAIASPYIAETVKRKDVNFSVIAKVLQPRTELFTDIPEQVDFIDVLPEYDLELYVNKKMKTNRETALIALKESLPVLEALSLWNAETVHSALFTLIQSLEVKNGYILWAVRVALSGKQFTPGGAIELAEILGKQESIERIKKGISLLAGAGSH